MNISLVMLFGMLIHFSFCDAGQHLFRQGCGVLLLIVTTAKHQAGVRGLSHLYALLHYATNYHPLTPMPFGSGYLELLCTRTIRSKLQSVHTHTCVHTHMCTHTHVYTHTCANCKVHTHTCDCALTERLRPR